MFLEKEISEKIKQGLKGLYGMKVTTNQIALQETRKGFAGSHTLALFSLAKQIDKSPEEVGQKLGKWLVERVDGIATYEVVSGFLNMTLTDATWLKGLVAAHTQDYRMPHAQGKRLLLEVSAPNTNKPLHLGHLRNVFLSMAVGRILEAVGYETIRVQHINDRGIHICKSMVGYLHFGKGKTPQEESIKGDYLVGKYYVAFEEAYRAQVAKLGQKVGSEQEARKEAPIMKEAEKMLRDWENGDEKVLALWRTMNGWVYDGFDATYERLGVRFDRNYYESETYLLGKAIVKEGMEKKIFYQREDGSIWVNLEKEGLGHKLLLRGDGTAVYITQDLGTADLRYADYHFDQSIYVVGNEQDYHFAVLFALLKKLNRPYADGLYHLSYGMVDLPSGKMKSREGKVVDADGLMDEMISLAAKRTEELGKVGHLTGQEREELARTIGLGALRYFLLRVAVGKRILFHPDQSIDFQGRTAPFIQYTCVRIASLLRSARDAPASYRSAEQVKRLLQGKVAMKGSEKELLQELLQYGDTLHQSAWEYNPALIADYIYGLAKMYNRFYNDWPIVKEEDEGLRFRRLFLSCETGRLIKHGLTLLGIGVPDWM